MTSPSLPFIMFFSANDKFDLSRMMHEKFPKYENVDSCGTRVAYKMDNFPDFVKDVKDCAKTLGIQLNRLMAVPNTGLGLRMDFPEDVVSGELDSLGRDPRWNETPHHLRPSSYVNYA